MGSWLKKGKKRSWFIFLSILLGFVFLLAVLYAKLLFERASYSQQDYSGEPESSPVSVMSPLTSSGSVHVEVLGRVKGKQTVSVRANVSGWVKRINSGLGREIEKDEIILELRDYGVETRLDEATYSLESVKGNLAEAQRVYERNKSLFEKGIVPEDSVEASRNSFETSLASVKAIEASYNRAKWNYDNLKIRSPIRGTVVEIVPDVGQEVRIGELVAEVVNLSGRKIVAAVDVSIAKKVKRGDILEISLVKDGVRETVTGEVDGVSPGSDDLSGTYDIEISISDTSVKWWPGEMVFVKIPVRKLDNVVRIPKTAVLSEREETFILVEKNGKADKVQVAVVWIDDNEGYIPFDSLPEGSRIIIEGNFNLRPGQSVNITE